WRAAATGCAVVEKRMTSAGTIAAIARRRGGGGRPIRLSPSPLAGEGRGGGGRPILFLCVIATFLNRGGSPNGLRKSALVGHAVECPSRLRPRPLHKQGAGCNSPPVCPGRRRDSCLMRTPGDLHSLLSEMTKY